jgi:hypothetical protein
MLISNEDEAEERLCRQIEAEQEPQFFKGTGVIILGFIKQDDGDDSVELSDGFFE